MDPDVAWQAIRPFVDASDNECADDIELGELVWVALDLLVWLANGGYPPTANGRTTRRAEVADHCKLIITNVIDGGGS